jgi:hypothetical protein
VIDAAGAIYVLGGIGVTTGPYPTTNVLYDVWKSTDGGVHRTRPEGGRGYWRGTLGVLKGIHWAFSAE